MDRVFCIAREICRNSNWTITNLELQKILYIAQMFSLGQRGTALFPNNIEAWDYGPVVPSIYHEFKFFGNLPIPLSAFPKGECGICVEDATFISAISDLLKGLKGWELVAITHRDGGAWQQTYRPGIKHLVISQDAMREEYTRLWNDQ